ncbi:MerR family transcriptional regulator [Rhodococcus sp. DMU2021]|nr:MerR family transcriptional regulator [Rhodococcus sp. DMU2021]MBX4168897.1 MerR family transcriptional regulator [Rhodococcus sp. DMU2021]
MRIGELSRRTGLSTRMLRYYEQEGLIHPERGANGYRDYTDDDVARAKLIRNLVGSGVPTRLVAIVLEQHDDRDGTWTSKYDRDFAARLVGEIEDLDGWIACLTRSREALGELLRLTLTHVGSREASV